MIGSLIIGAAVASSVMLAAGLRLRSLAAALCATYVLLVSDLVLATVALSPFRRVDQTGIGILQGIVLTAALATWWRRGRPMPDLSGSRRSLRELARSPVALGFVGVLLCTLAYELFLALSVPPNNWDSLTYHLARVAAWVQYGGWHWIPNAPSDILNTRQPVAEQEIFFLFAASKSTALFALPQYVAQLAILVAVYGASRRLGFGVASAVSAVGLLGTFSLVALESVTAQNDLVAASFPVVAACLVLGGSRAELLLAGAALGIGLGVKLTTVLAWPVVVAIAAHRGRRTLAVLAAGFACGLLAVGWWGYLLNTIHTGLPLGQGRLSLDVSASPSFPGSLHTSVHVAYRLFDLSVLSNRLVRNLAYAGAAAILFGATHGYRRGGLRCALVEALCASLPFFSPLLVIGGSEAFGGLMRLVGLPVRVSGFAGGLNRKANEDYSAFGPVGTVALLGLPWVVLGAALVRRAGRTKLLLAFSLPVFVLLLGLEASYNPFLTRFALVPAALSAPLLAVFFSSRAGSVGILVVSAIAIYLTLGNDYSEPGSAHPWTFDEVRALTFDGDPRASAALAAYERAVPPSACVGAILGSDEPSYVLYGPRLSHRVFYLPPPAGLTTAERDRIHYVVITTGSLSWTASEFQNAGWKLQPLGDYWQLASSAQAADHPAACVRAV
jgi:hypothetical protein